VPKADTAETKEPETKAETPAEIEAKRAALLEALADLPSAPTPAGLQPGTRIGEGITSEYVPFTPEWFMDVDARRKDTMPNGTLKWPSYQIHDIVPNGETIRLTGGAITVNGVGFALMAGRRCGLPSPHYTVYLDVITHGARHDAEFAPDPNPGSNSGYVSPHPYKMGDGVGQRPE
jgi:hypothetical protein